MTNKKLTAFFSGKNSGILLHTASGKNRQSLLFTEPVAFIECANPGHILKDLSKTQKLIDSGLYAAGYFSYELGYFLEKKLRKNPYRLSSPLFKLMFFRKPQVFKNLDLSGNTAFAVSQPCPSLDFKQYSKGFSEIKSLIKNGEIYQANYCFNLDFTLRGSLKDFFAALAKKQPSPYSAFMRFGDEAVISFSPELFYERTGDKIIMKPMKGTLLKPASKAALARFKTDPKTLAENLMIVDLIRNDLGKLCKTKSVKADKMFQVEEYPTLWQMTSTVSGILKEKPGLEKITRALFPSGSVTGAPKLRAMQVIAECEKTSRGIYTGAIGYLSRTKSVFNIPIRTAVIETVTGKTSFGVGSGIVNDSRLASEYAECLGKARFLAPDVSCFYLIETILYNGGFSLLDGHLKRMGASAEYFGIPFSKTKTKQLLFKTKLKADKKYKVRLLLYADGKLKIETRPLTVTPNDKIRIAKIKTGSKDIFLRHKTNLRTLYNTEYNKAAANGLADYVFTNEKGEITEGCVTNVFIKRKGIYYTPPVSCGLLGGVYREHLLRTNPKTYREKVMTFKDLKKADEIYLCNSVRGLFRVYF